MTRLVRPLSRSFLALTLVWAAPAFGGYVLTDQDGSPTWISAGKVRTEKRESDESIVIDLASGKMTLIRHTEKTYATGTPEELCSALERAMEKMKQTLPKEARDAMEQMRGQKPGADQRAKAPAVVVSSAGKGEPIAGFATEKYAVKLDGKPYEEIWITADSGLLKEFTDPAKWIALEQRMEKCMASELAGTGGSQGPESSPEYQKLMQKGFVLKSVRVDPTASVGRPDTLVVKAETKSIPESDFQAPKGYRKLTLEEMIEASIAGAVEGKEE